MKCGRLESAVGPDRLATPDEVRSACSFPSAGGVEFCGQRDDCSQMNSPSSRRPPTFWKKLNG